MSPDLRLLVVWLAAYLAAGAFYVLRGLADAGMAAGKDELCGLGLIALCWLPIAVCNLLNLSRTCRATTALVRFGAEAMPPLALVLAIVTAVRTLSTT
ncbi:hypothetical protein [Methylobacterium sp. NFXW15]|uniref:hypothetical protein n=1 Tax=Methylobacterium sp. NFXW15 TaxID=2819512 RepID=UPI003CF87315